MRKIKSVGGQNKKVSLMSSRTTTDPGAYDFKSSLSSSSGASDSSSAKLNVDLISSNCSDRCPFKKVTVDDNALLVDDGQSAKEKTGKTALIEKGYSFVEKEIRRGIVDLAKSRGPAKSICPSEVARSIFPVSCWRHHMQLVRNVGFSLAEIGIVVVTQRNQTILPANFQKIRGPIRFKIQEPQ